MIFSPLQETLHPQKQLEREKKPMGIGIKLIFLAI
jgi:hypothetical protein